MVDKLIRHQTSALFALAALHFFRAVGILVGQLIGEALLVDARSTTIAMLVVLVFAALVGLGSKGMVITLSGPAKEGVIGIPKANIAALVERDPGSRRARTRLSSCGAWAIPAAT